MKLRYILILVLPAVVALSASIGDKGESGKPSFKSATTLVVNGSHLHVPVHNIGDIDKAKAGMVVVGIFDGKRLVQNFKVNLPRKGESYWIATYPLEHFKLQGKTVKVKVIPAAKKKKSKGGAKASASLKQWVWAVDRFAIGDDLPGEKVEDYAKPYRNQFHASTRRGWIQDPNGLVYHNGKYHLYYQYNPFGIWPSNKHWGHWESEDMIHWREHPIALYANPPKDQMFSGGGFVDFNNSAGLGENTLFAAFTSTARGECLAYSKDDGLTFTELPENPVVQHRGRDPKIIWYEPEQKWVMIVYNMEECAETKAVPTEEGGKFKNSNMAFYESKDLRSWKRTGAFTDSDRFAVWECPEFFELQCGDESRWILYGGQNRYFIGQFNGKTFVRESGPHGEDVGSFETHPFAPQGAFYAAQTFSDVPDGRRIQVAWMKVMDDYTKLFPDQLTSQAMTFPHELKLRRTDDGLRMTFTPVDEVEKLRAGELDSLEDCKGELTEVLIEFEEGGRHALMINGIDASFEGKSARIFTDRTFNEVYADGGLYYKVRARRAANFDSTETGVKNGTIKSLKVYRLKSIWK